MNFNLDRRCSDLIEVLQEYDDFCTVDHLASRLNQTRRRIQYDIGKLNDIFSQSNIPPIEARRNKGVRILDAHRSWWSDIQKKSHKNYNYIFTQKERKDILLCENLLKDNITTISEMADRLGVSRNTIFLDIKELKKELKDDFIELEYAAKNGYRLKGDGLYARRLFMYSLASIYPLIESGILSYLDDEQIKSNYAKLSRMEKEMKVRFRTVNKNKISILLKYMESDCPKIEDVDRNNDFYLAAARYFPSYSDNNLRYIAIQLMGARRVEGAVIESDNDAESMEYAKFLVEHFEQRMSFSLNNREVLLYNLQSHLKSAIYRYKYGIMDNYEIEKSVKAEAQELFNLLKLSVKALSQKIHYPINDSEIALLVAHFGAHLKHYQNDMNQASVILVTQDKENARKLRRKIEYQLPMLQVTETILPEQLKEYGDKHIILATCKLKYNGFHTYISGELSARDKKEALNVYLRYQNYHEGNITETLFTNIKKYIPREQQEKVQIIINETLLGAFPGLSYLIQPDYVQCIKTINDWRRAVSYAGRPLMQNRSIDRSYIDAAILGIETGSCYTYLGSGVFLAYTQNIQNVSESGVSVLTIKNGVRMAGGYDVKMILFIAAINQNQHFSILKEAVTLCSDSQKIEEMMKCRSKVKLFHQIQHFIDKDYEEKR